MADRLTQLQVCVDQLVEQFNATVNYVNTQSVPALLDEDDPMSPSNIAAAAPLPGAASAAPNVAASSASPALPSETVDMAGTDDQNAAFLNTLNELSTDIILKSRQISMLIDLLPGIGVSPESQIALVDELMLELKQVQDERDVKIKEKDKVLEKCDDLILKVAEAIKVTRS